MNTEKIRTLEQIHEAIELVEDARAASGLTPEQSYDLETASINLWNLEMAVIRKKGDELIDILTADADALNELAGKIKNSADRLEKVAGSIEKAVVFVRVLINIIVSAGGAGLL